MVLLDEDPALLISETTNEFRIAPDKESLSRLSSNLAALAAGRAQRLDQQHASLKALSRKLNTVRSQYEYEQGRRNTGQHASEVLALDGEKFRIAKAVNETEADSERLASELSVLRRQLENGEVAQARSDDSDAAVLKLQLYRSLGVELITSNEERSYDKAVIRNDKEVTVLGIGTTTTANAVWDCM